MGKNEPRVPNEAGLYAKIQRIVEGKEQEPANPPQLLLGSSRGEKGKEGHNSAGFKQGEGHEESNDDDDCNGGEGNGGEDTCGWVMENMHSVFFPNGKPLISSTVCTWKKQLEKKEAHQIADATGKKRGPKPSRPCGEIQQSKTNNTKVPYSLLCLLAGMVVAQYNARFPLSTTLLMPMVLKIHKISWVPSQSWYREFLLKIGLKYRTITKSARSLPENFIEVKRMFLRRVVFILEELFDMALRDTNQFHYIIAFPIVCTEFLKSTSPFAPEEDEELAPSNGAAYYFKERPDKLKKKGKNTQLALVSPGKESLRKVVDETSTKDLMLRNLVDLCFSFNCFPSILDHSVIPREYLVSHLEDLLMNDLFEIDHPSTVLRRIRFYMYISCLRSLEPYVNINMQRVLTSVLLQETQSLDSKGEDHHK
ncbi:hypothetical protein EMCRGX_G002442 [Ephydatia muelleri]